MLFEKIIGQETVKQQLVLTVNTKRISHAQLFLGSEGSGNLALAIAYAQYISCENKQESDSCNTCLSCIKYEKLIHPDLHFVYPVATTSKISKSPKSIDFLEEWRQAVLHNSYLTLFNWLEYLGIENKQGYISAEESQEILKKLNLKTYESPYKIMIIWMPEKMHPSAANKLLKILEEPPANTLFLLVAEGLEYILKTILSRTQLVKIPPIAEESLQKVLAEKHGLPLEKAKQITHFANGNYNKALEFAEESNTDLFNFEMFQQWMRNCYQKNIGQILSWIDQIAETGRERQKNFIAYTLHVIRESFIINLGVNSLVKLTEQELNFIRKFSSFVHTKNIVLLNEYINKAYQDIERNAHPKITFLDLSFKIATLLKVPIT